MQKAIVMPPHKVAYHDETETVQMRIYKSLKVWSMYADLEESFGTFKVFTAVVDFVPYSKTWLIQNSVIIRDNLNFTLILHSKEEISYEFTLLF
jgi:hypothetical protein